MHRVCIGVGIGHESGMHRGVHQVITLSVKLGEGGLGARPDRGGGRDRSIEA